VVVEKRAPAAAGMISYAPGRSCQESAWSCGVCTGSGTAHGRGLPVNTLAH